MRLPKKALILALGTMFATAGAIYAAPAQRFDGRGDRDHDRDFRVAENYEQRGQAMVREGEQLERRGQYRRGEALERRGRELIRQGEALEHRWR